MQLCVPLKALTFLFVTLFNPFLSASSRNRPPKHARLALPTDNVALSPVTFGTPLKNLSMNLGNLLMKTPIGKVFYIQAMKGDSQTEYFYGINFYETDPFFLATYTIECGLINEQLAPIIIHSSFKETASLGLNPEAAVFFPSAHLHGHCHTPRAHGSHTLQPLSAPLTHYQEPHMHALPHIPPLISSILSYRKSALIDAMQQQKSTRTVDGQWQKILKIVCADSSYPFSNLNLSFPTTEEVLNTPRQVRYTTEAVIKEMEEEARRESISKERRKILEIDIAILKQFMIDIQIPHPLAYDGTQRRLECITQPTPPPSAPAPIVTLPPVKTTVTEDPNQKTFERQRAGVLVIPSAPAKNAPLAKKPNAPQSIAAKNLMETKKATLPPVLPIPVATKPAVAITPTAINPTPLSSTAAKKPTQEDFFVECAEAATVSTLPVVKESSGPSKFEKKEAAAAAYHLKKLAKEREKEAATAAKITQEEERYSAIKIACDQEDYASAISTLALCDETTEKFTDTICSLTKQLPQKKYREDFSQLIQLVTNLLKQKKITLSNEKRSHLLLYLSTSCDLKMRLTYLREAADLKNVVAEAQWLALKIKEQLDDPDFKPCAHGERCLHKKVTLFFTLHAENDLLKPLLATYLLSLFSMQSRCPNIELKAPLDDLYTMAKRHLSSEDYTFLLTLRPQSTHKKARLECEEGASYMTTQGRINLDALVESALQHSLPLLVSPDPTFIVFFKKFHLDVKKTYQKPHSKTETRAMLKDFFKEKIINSGQIYFAFEMLIEEPELAIFYEVLNELISEKQLPLLSEEEFKALSHSIASSIAAQLYAVENDTRPAMEFARTYLRKILTTATTNSSRPLSTSAQRPITFSYTPFTNSLLEIFNRFNMIRNEFEEKMKNPPKGRQKSIEILFTRRKDAIHQTIIALLKTAQTKEDVNHFLIALSQFEVNESYAEMREAIDTYLQTSSEHIQQAWRPYVILPNPCKFSSLRSCSIPGSFPVRCTVFQKQLTEYLANAPLEKEVFKAVEALIIQFLATTQTHKDIEFFLKTFDHKESFCFCIGGLFNHLQRSGDPESSTSFELVMQFERYLIEHIKDTTETAVSVPLHTYLKETLSAIQLFIKEKSRTPTKAAASFEGTVTLPAETEYSDPQKNKFLSIVTEIVSHTEEKTKIVDALFAHILKLSPPELPSFIYALGTNAKPLLLDIRQKVALSEELHPLIKQMLLMGFETLCN